MTQIKLNNVIQRTTDLEGFFLLWLECIRHLHNLTKTEMLIVSYLLKKRYDLSLEVKNPNIIDSLLRMDNVKNEIIKKANITDNTYSVHLQHIKEKGIIKEGRICPQWIPNIDDDTFMLMTMIKINDFKSDNSENSDKQ